MMLARPCPPAPRRIAQDDSILIIEPEWLELILSGVKSLEIRKPSCHGKIGREILLAASGTSRVYGKARVSACFGPLSADEWEAMRAAHRVEGGRTYGEKTHAWQLTAVTRVRPTPFVRKVGAIIWQTGPGNATE